MSYRATYFTICNWLAAFHKIDILRKKCYYGEGETEVSQRYELAIFVVIKKQNKLVDLRRRMNVVE